jgi:hypothetical protein
MNKSLSIALLVFAGIFLCVLIFGAGFLVGRATSGWASFGPSSMMGWNYRNQGNPILGNDRNFFGWGGMMGNNRGMMGGIFTGNAANAEPLTVDQAKQAVEAYLKNLGNSDLELEEIMILTTMHMPELSKRALALGRWNCLLTPPPSLCSRNMVLI